MQTKFSINTIAMSLLKPVEWRGDATEEETTSLSEVEQMNEDSTGLDALNAGAEPFADAEPGLSWDGLCFVLQEDDMRRLDFAQRLHKDVAGGLVACTAVGEMIRQEFAQREISSHLATLLASMDSTLRQTIQVVREMTEAQFPPVLKAFGLSAALQQLVRDLAEHFVGALVLHIKGEEAVFEPVRRMSVYRLLEVLLNRCVRNPRTSWAEVTCTGTRDHAEFTIDYDCDEALWGTSESGADAQIVEARCALLDATLEVTHSPTGRCHRLLLSVPLTNGTQA